jgi:hypothetical protein
MYKFSRNKKTPKVKNIENTLDTASALTKYIWVNNMNAIADYSPGVGERI